MYSPLYSPNHSSVRDLRVSRLTTVDSLGNHYTFTKSKLVIGSPHETRTKSLGKKFSNLQNAIDSTYVGVILYK